MKSQEGRDHLHNNAQADGYEERWDKNQKRDANPEEREEECGYEGQSEGAEHEREEKSKRCEGEQELRREKCLLLG